MIEAKYSTFEQAKKLKEKGFDEYCVMKYFLRKPSGYGSINYNKETPYNITGYDGILLNEKYIDNNVFIYAPEQWEVVEWLRVNHGIWVIADHSIHPDGYYWMIKNLKTNKIIHSETNAFQPNFKSPQEAYSAAFDYVLNNLI